MGMVRSLPSMASQVIAQSKENRWLPQNRAFGIVCKARVNPVVATFKRKRK